MHCSSSPVAAGPPPLADVGVDGDGVVFRTASLAGVADADTVAMVLDGPTSSVFPIGGNQKTVLNVLIGRTYCTGPIS